MPTLGQRITIDVSFATEFQRDASLHMLKVILETWKAQVQARHAKNKVEITFDHAEEV